jgi:hypothetical protein
VMAFVMVAFADKSRHQNTSTKTVFWDFVKKAKRFCYQLHT